MSFAKSIRSWTKLENLDNVRAPIDLEVCRFPWPVTRADAVLCVNMIHVAPWAATQALFLGAKCVLDLWRKLFGPVWALSKVWPPYRRKQ